MNNERSNIEENEIKKNINMASEINNGENCVASEVEESAKAMSKMKETMKKSAAKWRMKEISESVMKERRNNNI
jgi:hypothetical protein